MYRLLVVLILFSAKAQAPQAIFSIDLVKVKDGRHKEALYFFENNWKVYRDSALKSGSIASYKLLRNTKDVVNAADIILITEYKDQNAYNQREQIFRPLMNALRPKGIQLLNNLKREDFIESTTNMVTEALYSQ